MHGLIINTILFWTTMVEKQQFLLWVKRWYYTCFRKVICLSVCRSPAHNAVWHRDIWASPTCNTLAIRSGVARSSHRSICSSFHCSVICNADLLYESWNKMFYLLASSLYYQIKALQILCELCSCHLLANFWLFTLVNNFVLQNQSLEDEVFLKKNNIKLYVRYIWQWNPLSM